MNLYLKKIENKSKYFLIFLLSIVVVTVVFSTYIKSQNYHVIQFNSYESFKLCENQKLKDLNNVINVNQGKDIEISFVSLSIYPEFANIYCLGKVIEVFNEETDAVTLLYMTNYKFFEFIFSSLTILYIFIAFLLNLNQRQLNLKIIFLVSYLISVVNLSSIFTLNNNFYGIFPNFKFPINIISLTLLLFPFVFRNVYFLFLPIFYYANLDYDYFPLYAFIFLYLFYFKYNFPNKKNLVLTSFLPISFLTTRYISALTQNLDFLWQQLFQNSYVGFTRFYDLQTDYFRLKCHGYPTETYELLFNKEHGLLTCPKFDGYGPLRQLLILNGDIWTSVLVTYAIIFILFLVHYFDMQTKFPNDVFFLSIIFLNPSINFMIHTGNPDIFYFSTLYFILKYFNNSPLFFTFLIYISTLWKIHSVGILIGVMFFGIIIKSSSLKKLSSFFIILTAITYFINSKLVEPLNIPGAPDERVGFGILHDAKQLTKYFEYLNFIQFSIFYFILFFFLMVASLYILKKSLFDFNIEKNLQFYGISFWFLLSMIYENQSYRLPLYLFIFVLVFRIESKALKLSVMFALLFNPVISTNNILFEKVSLLANRFGLYLFTSYLIANILNDFLEYLSDFPSINNSKTFTYINSKVN